MLNEPLCAPAIAHGKVSGEFAGTYAVRIPGGYKLGKHLLARCLTSPDAPLHRFSWVWNSWVFRDKTKNPDKSKNLEHYFSELIERACRDRFISFNADGYLVSDGEVAVRHLMISTQANLAWSTGDFRSEFFWNDVKDPQELSLNWRMFTPDRQIEDGIRTMLANPDSDCSFAWHWAESRKARNRMMLQIESGTAEELELLLRAILWQESLHDEFLEKINWQCKFDFFRFNVRSASSGMRFVARRMTVFGDRFGWFSFPFFERYYLLLELILSLMGVSFNKAIEESGVAQWSQLWEGYNFVVPLTRPTQHEFLESQILLRDFLRDKVSPAELAELMGR